MRARARTHIQSISVWSFRKELQRVNDKARNWKSKVQAPHQEDNITIRTQACFQSQLAYRLSAPGLPARTLLQGETRPIASKNEHTTAALLQYNFQLSHKKAGIATLKPGKAQNQIMWPLASLERREKIASKEGALLWSERSRRSKFIDILKMQKSLVLRAKQQVTATVRDSLPRKKHSKQS